MIGIVVGPLATHNPQWRIDMGITTPDVIHDHAPWWLGPACNFGHDPADRLITGVEVAAERVTCWRCRYAAEATAMNAERGVR